MPRQPLGQCLSRFAGNLAFAALLLVAGSANAGSTVYSITQGGWSGGGSILGTFSGEDINHDGHIDLASGEVSAYQVAFSGNNTIPAFTHSFADLLYFNYTVGSPGFRPSFPLYSTNGEYFYDADDHIIGNAAFTVFTNTQMNALVSPVPEHPSLMLLASGLLGLSLNGLRRGARSSASPI